MTVRSLVEARDQIGLVLQCGHEGLEREIRSRSAVKPGLVLTGIQRAHGDAVHGMGKAEHEYLSVRPPSEQRRILMDYVNSGVPCVVMCWGLAPLPVLLEVAESHGVPIINIWGRRWCNFDTLTLPELHTLAPIR